MSLVLLASAIHKHTPYTRHLVEAYLVAHDFSERVVAAQVVLCKISGSQFGNMYEVGQASYAHYALEGLPKDPAGFLAPWQDRCFPLPR